MQGCQTIKHLPKQTKEQGLNHPPFVATGVTVGLTGTTGLGLGTALLVAAGVTMGVAAGVTGGVAFTVLAGVALTVVTGVATGVAVTLAAGVATGAGTVVVTGDCPAAQDLPEQGVGVGVGWAASLAAANT